MTDQTPKRPPDPARHARSRHANKISRKLKEKELRYRKQVSKIIYLCGHDFADEVFEQTLEVEANGGMMILNGKRRRTPGGVFVYLAKGRMTDEQYLAFVGKPRNKKTAAVSPTQEPPSEPVADESVQETPPEEIPPTLPENLPPEVQAKLKPLYAAAKQFQQRIADIETSGKSAGLQSAKLMLKATQQKITAIEAAARVENG
jgi:hypothetical protein